MTHLENEVILNRNVYWLSNVSQSDFSLPETNLLKPNLNILPFRNVSKYI